MNDEHDDPSPAHDADFEWQDAEEPAPPQRSRSRGRARKRRGGGGGRLSIPPPSPRLLGLLVAAVVLVVVIVLVVRDCQRDQLVDSYKTYVADSTALITESAGQGESLREVLNNNDNRGPQQIQTAVRQLANQSQSVVDETRQLDPPGKLDDAQASLITAFEYRTNGLNTLADNLPALIGSSNVNAAATGIAEQMQRFLASDVIYDDSFVGPALVALEDDNIADVEIPEGDEVHFLPGNTTRLASPTGARSLVGKLKTGGGGSGDDATASDDETGTLRGLGLLSVEAQPSGQQLSTSNETTVSSEELVWKVTLENGGDFEEQNVPVTVTLSYPENPNDTITAERNIDVIQPKEQLTLDVPLSGNPRLGESGTLTVNIEPVEGETSTQNNRAEYPVKISF
ncbi:MAG: hypothetical protein OEM67_02805 [Thermoleophilia bacterium]|nr:hypothetical protein [Thermoleophilia bacterium]MDH3724443.1 hypothetical protein [Thermoleophilia bacterium]